MRKEHGRRVDISFIQEQADNPTEKMFERSANGHKWGTAEILHVNAKPSPETGRSTTMLNSRLGNSVTDARLTRRLEASKRASSTYSILHVVLDKSTCGY